MLIDIEINSLHQVMVFLETDLECNSRQISAENALTGFIEQPALNRRFGGCKAPWAVFIFPF